MSRTIVHCENVTKTFGSGASAVFALRGIDLDVYEGEILMLVGPSGCGKTTFVSIITTLLRYDSGICHVLGYDLHQISEQEKIIFRRNAVGYVFQTFNLLPALTSLENIALPLLVSGMRRERALAKALEILKEVGLEAKKDATPAQLSGGEQQKVAIARALVHAPELIVCDEPTSSLDHQSGQMVMALLTKMTKEKGKTMIIVTHDNRIYDYGDRMAYMEDGRIVKVEKR